MRDREEIDALLKDLQRGGLVITIICALVSFAIDTDSLRYVGICIGIAIGFLLVGLASVAIAIVHTLREGIDRER